VKKRVILAVAAAALVASALAGCSAFKTKRRVNLSPFAQHIMAMSEDAQYGLSEERAVWLRRYADDPDIADLVGKYRTSADRALRIIRGILVYSLELVTLAQLDISGEEKADALAEYLDDLISPAFDLEFVEFRMTPEEFDTVVVNISKQPTLIDGLNAAQPVVDEIARLVGDQILDVETLQFQIEQAVNARIEEYHGPQLAFMDFIKERHSLALVSLQLLVDALEGDREALEGLRRHDPLLLRDVPEGRTPTEAQAEVLLERLMARLDKIERIRSSVRSDLEDYERELDELHRLGIQGRSSIRKARVVALAWAQAHRKLASGIVDPAKIDMMGITRSVLKTAL
jgi:hypothetical protein